jgi:hypothetical protein
MLLHQKSKHVDTGDLMSGIVFTVRGLDQCAEGFYEREYAAAVAYVVRHDSVCRLMGTKSTVTKALFKSAGWLNRPTLMTLNQASRGAAASGYFLEKSRSSLGEITRMPLT